MFLRVLGRDPGDTHDRVDIDLRSALRGFSPPCQGVKNGLQLPLRSLGLTLPCPYAGTGTGRGVYMMTGLAWTFVDQM